jgi:hypothetical protein
MLKTGAKGKNGQQDESGFHKHNGKDARSFIMNGGNCTIIPFFDFNCLLP